MKNSGEKVWVGKYSACFLWKSSEHVLTALAPVAIREGLKWRVAGMDGLTDGWMDAWRDR